MAGVGEEAPQTTPIEKRPHHLDVHQMRAAEIGIVDEDNVTGFEILPPLNDSLCSGLHDSDENGQPKLALGDYGAIVGTINAVGSIECFRDNRRERRLLMNQVHFTADLLKRILDYRERDRVDNKRRIRAALVAAGGDAEFAAHFTLRLRG